MKRYGQLLGGIIAAWFVFALSASPLGLFQNTYNRIGIAVALAASVPILLFAFWYASSREFRHYLFGLNPQTLTAAQVWRVMGVTFVVLQARNLLPARFAQPAGYGDIFIGATAALVAWKLGKPRHRTSFMLWQALGITDLLVAVGLGTTSGLVNPAGPSMAPMTALPLSLIPTFLVPLFFILHIICLAQAKRWSTSSNLELALAAGVQPVP